MITHISPVGTMALLSQLEVDRLKATASSDLYRLYRNCSLAVLNSGSHTDSSKELLEQYKTFDINVQRRERGIKLELVNPPEHAFVDKKLIRGIQEHMFSVLRDIVYVNMHLELHKELNLTSSTHITNFVFSILRNAKALHAGEDPNIVVCWGGHSINPTEYQYTREVGNELGLVIMPDIEKRLEAFIRLGDGIVIFPGGAGTAEEFLYILGILMDPSNADQPMPVVLTGPKESEEYFRTLDSFIRDTLGEAATKHYQIIIDDPAAVAKVMKKAMPKIKAHRQEKEDAYCFNWSLNIPSDFQHPFEPTHEAMASLDLHTNQKPEQLAANLRRAFSGIVAGNVKEEGIQAIEKYGKFQINGEASLMKRMDKLLQSFVDQQRMKLPGSKYEPCYEIITESEPTAH